MKLLFLVIATLLFARSTCQGISGGFAQQTLHAHNYFRDLHGQEPLTWSKKLVAVAHRWCRKLNKKKLFKHSQQKKYGENLFIAWKFGRKPARPLAEMGARATRRWWEEIHKYDYDTPGFKKATGHFTQVNITFAWQWLFFSFLNRRINVYF